MSVDMNTIHTLHNRYNHLNNIFKNGVPFEDIERLSIYINYSISLIDEEFSNGSVEFFEEKNELNTLRDNFIAFKTQLDTIKTKGDYSKTESVEHSDIKTEKTIVNAGSNDSSSDSIIAKLFTILGVIGVVAACVTFFYAYWNTFSDIVKLFMVDVLGIGGIVIGYNITKKTGNVFYNSIVAVGIAILYVGIAFTLALGSECINTSDKYMYSIIAGVTCVLVTISSLWVSQKLNSKLLTLATLIGLYVSLFFVYGYLGLEVGVYSNIVTSIFIGFCLYKSKDNAVNITAHILNSINMIWLGVTNNSTLHAADVSIGVDLSITSGLCTFILLCIFVMHIVLPIVRHYKEKESLSNTDVGLMVYTTLAFVLYFFATEFTLAPLVCIFGLGFLFVANRLLKGSLITDAKYSLISFLGILLFIISPLNIERGIISVLWIGMTFAFLYLWDLTDKDVFKYASSCLLVMFIFTHGLCDNSLTNFTNAFWSDYGRYVTEALSCVVYVYVAYLMSKKKSGVAMQICYSISLLSLFYIATQYTNLIIDNIGDTNRQSMRALYGLDINDIVGGLIGFAMSIYTLFILKLADLKKNKMLSGISIAVSSLLVSIFCIASLFCNAFGFYSDLHREADIIPTSSYVITFLSVTCTLVIITAIFTYLFMIAINSFGKEVINDRLRKFILTVIISLSLISHIIALLDANGLYGSVACIVLGAVWVLQGFKLHFKGMRYVGLGVVSIFLVRVLFGVSSVPDDIKPIVYILVALSCFGVGWVYTYLSKREKNEEACIDD